jgi:hypothetical protein
VLIPESKAEMSRLLSLRVITAISLFLCAVTILLWITSYFRSDYLIYQPRFDWVKREYGIGVVQGGFIFDAEMPRSHPGLTIGYRNVPVTPWPLQGTLHGFGPVHFARNVIPYGYFSSELVLYSAHIHWWFLTLLFTLPSIIRRALWLRARPDRREKAGLCRACGYDMRATPDRCPECGYVRHSAIQQIS